MCYIFLGFVKNAPNHSFRVLFERIFSIRPTCNFLKKKIWQQTTVCFSFIFVDIWVIYNGGGGEGIKL